MKYSPISYLLFLILATCTAATAAPTAEAPKKAAGPTEVELHSKLIEGAIRVSGGTGVCIAHDGPYYTILTAAHVVNYLPPDPGQIQGDPYVICRIYTKTDGVKTEAVSKFLFINHKLDLAAFNIRTEVPVFEIMSNTEYNALDIGEKLWSAGHPTAVVPCLISVGFINDLEYDEDKIMLFHSSTGWYGYSGGPVIHVTTGKLVGIESAFTTAHVTYESLAVNAVTINYAIANPGK